MDYLKNDQLMLVGWLVCGFLSLLGSVYSCIRTGHLKTFKDLDVKYCLVFLSILLYGPMMYS